MRRQKIFSPLFSGSVEAAYENLDFDWGESVQNRLIKYRPKTVKTESNDTQNVFDFKHRLAKDNDH